MKEVTSLHAFNNACVSVSCFHLQVWNVFYRSSERVIGDI